MPVVDVLPVKDRASFLGQRLQLDTFCSSPKRNQHWMQLLIGFAGWVGMSMLVDVSASADNTATYARRRYKHGTKQSSDFLQTWYKFVCTVCTMGRRR